MRIGEIAQITGFTVDTIRWYEKIGLLNPQTNTSISNNYKIFGDEEVQTLTLIKQAKKFGFTIREIKTLVALEASDNLKCKNVSSMVSQKIDEVSREIDTLLEIKSKLTFAISSCQGSCKETLNV